MFQSLDEVPTACTTIEEVGSTGVGALTVAFLILIISTIIFLLKGWSSLEQKSYYVCSTYVCGFAAMAYFAMLSGQGWTAVAGCRQFFYARYADWIVSFPLLMLLLGIVANADTASIGAGMGAIVVYIFGTYMGSVSVVTTVKWFWFFVALVGLGGALISITRTFKIAAVSRGTDIEQLYGKMAWLTFLVWLAYPIVWLFSEGFASFSVSFEVCSYALLDVLSKVVVSFVLLSGHDALSVAAPKEFA
jgi:bacteriorhodopsin